VITFHQKFGRLLYGYVELLHLKLVLLILQQDKQSVDLDFVTLQVNNKQIIRLIRRDLRLKNSHPFRSLHTFNRPIVSDALVMKQRVNHDTRI
jgi:hypothetical protein